jgi:hypothetical protein
MDEREMDRETKLGLKHRELDKKKYSKYEFDTITKEMVAIKSNKE